MVVVRTSVLAGPSVLGIPVRSVIPAVLAARSVTLDRMAGRWVVVRAVMAADRAGPPWATAVDREVTAVAVMVAAVMAAATTEPALHRGA